MRYFVPMLLLIGVVVIMGSFRGDSFRNARGILFVIGLLLLMAIVFAYIVRRAI